MCGRFTLTTPTQRLADQFELAGGLQEVTPSYNIAPTQDIATVAADSEGYRQLRELHWGLIPRWTKDPEIGSRMINARAESVAEKNSFKSAFKKRRCLILADGFYEWQRDPSGSGPKQPYYLPPEAINGEDWLLTDAQTASRLTKMRASSIPLGEYVGARIYRGVVTGLNEAFVIDGSKRQELISANPESEEIIKPFLVGRNIRKYHANIRDKWLLYMYRGVDVSNLDAVLEHLELFRDRLEKRATKQEWYELQQPQMKYAAAFKQPKIVFPDIAKRPRFAFDSAGSFIGDTTFMIATEDLYTLGVLNSSIVENFFVEIGATVRGGYLRFKTQYVEHIPIPDAPAADREAIADLVQGCLDTKGVGREEQEREIDERVAKLYGVDVPRSS